MSDKREVKMTNQMRSYVIVLYLYEAGEGGSTKQVVRKWFANALCMEWQTANSKQLDKLVTIGFMKCIVGGNQTKFYSLTKRGRKVAKQCIEDARAYQWDFEQPELFEEVTHEHVS